MAELDEKIKLLKKKPHCSNCGAIEPKIFGYAQIDRSGFTVCCNEAVCVNEEDFYFGTTDLKVQACCWAVAELEFKNKGVDILSLPEIKRFQ